MDAGSRAPRGATGDLAESYAAEKNSDGWAVMALWRWFFTEFGTAESAAQPHVVPAVEQERARTNGRVRAALKDI